VIRSYLRDINRRKEDAHDTDRRRSRPGDAREMLKFCLLLLLADSEPGGALVKQAQR
jgi:hypothetical protein